MTMTSLGLVMRYPDTADFNWTTIDTAQIFDSATDLLAAVFHIPVTGTIANVHYRVKSVSSPSLTLRTELRTVSATTGFPNAAGTLYGSSTSITSVNPTTGNKTAAVNCTGATAGNLVALVFDISAYTSGSVTMTTDPCSGSFGSACGFPYTVANTSGTTATAIHTFNGFALEYSGGVYYPLECNSIVGANSGGVTVTNSGVTRRGNRFRPPVAMRAVGMWAVVDADGDCVIRLRKQSDDSILGTCTIDKDVRGSTLARVVQLFFDSMSPVTLAAGTDYYAVVEGTTATAVTLPSITSIPAAGQLAQMAGGVNCFGTSYNAGYSDDNTTLYGAGVLFDQVDDGTGSGASGGGMHLVGHGGLAG